MVSVAFLECCVTQSDVCLFCLWGHDLCLIDNVLDITISLLENVNPTQKQKLQSLFPFELFRIIFELKVCNEYLKILKGEEDMPSDHVGDEALAVEQAVSTLINFIYPTSLSTVLMEVLYIRENTLSGTPYKSHCYFSQAQEQSVIVSLIDVDNCSPQPANKCKASTQVCFSLLNCLKISIIIYFRCMTNYHFQVLWNLSNSLSAWQTKFDINI